MLFTRFIQIMCLCGIILYAQPANANSVPQKTFIYRVKVSDVTNTATFSAINPELKNIFDENVRFNDTTDEIIIHSDWDVSQDKLTEVLNKAGYLLKSYRQAIVPSRDY